MKPVRTIQKYKCDFCKKRSVKHVMAVHEKRCYRNPDRYCDFCENKGYLEHLENDMPYKTDCPYCANFDETVLKEIKEREEKERLPAPRESEIPLSEVPF